MKNSVAIFACCIVLFTGCSNGAKKISYIQSILDTLNIDKTKNIIIYTINPNDCINCINGFKSVNNSLSASPNSKLYIVAVEREVEKKALIAATPMFDFMANDHKFTIWNKDVFNKINNSMHINLAVSSICVYNYKLDSVVYCNPIREINDQEELFLHL